MKINTGSWHYRFAMWTRGGSPIRPNLCSYTWAFFASSFLVAMFCLLALIVLVPAGDFLGWLAACIMCARWITPGLAIFFMGLATVAILIAALVYSVDGEKMEPVREIIRAKKERYCPTVEYVHD